MFVKYTSFLLVVAIFMLRPTLLGEHFSSLAALIVSAVFMCVVLKYKFAALRLSLPYVVLSSLIMGYYLYLLVIVTLKGGNGQFVINELVITFTTVIPLVFMFAFVDYRSKTFDYLIKVMSTVGWSTGLTLILIQYFPYTDLAYAEIATDGGDDKQVSMVLFPFSSLYHASESLASSEGFLLLRFNSFFRESGTCQAFYAWALISLIHSRRLRSLWCVGLIVGFCASASTSTLLTMPFVGIAAIRRLQLSRILKYFITSVSFVVFGAAFLYFPYIGFLAKASSYSVHSSSISDRSAAITKAMTDGMQTPFGSFGADVFDKNASICLISQILVIGLTGFVIVVLIYIVPACLAKSSRADFVLEVAPVFFTALLAQPMATLPFSLIAIALSIKDSVPDGTRAI